uniref:Uncharacterized protein n=1 Tax=Arcella intermedia TaxID=1963864 RepID=A0A6B2L5W2_9EUKA
MHWVFKIGSLEKTIAFYSKVFQMKIHRHEEFGSGCEATCNGPYGGAWSKTMVGYGSEITNTSLELTYNYGVEGYELGNDYRYIAIAARDFAQRAREAGADISPTLPGGYQVVSAPDGYRFLLVPGTEGCNGSDPFLFVSLHVTDLKKSLQYYTQVLGFKVFNNVLGALGTSNSAVIGFEESTFKIELVELDALVKLDHKKGIGRLAIETEDEAPATVGEKVKAAGHVIAHGPFKLPPHDEHVVIVADPDGYEYCFVGQTGYRAGSLSVKNNTIDWDHRKKLNDAATSKAAAPAQALPGSVFQAVVGQEAFQGVLKGEKPVVVKFAASWCKPCKVLAPVIEKVAEERKDSVCFVSLDFDENQQIAESLEVTSVPAVFFFRNGSVVGSFFGVKKEQELRELFQKYL